MVSLAAPTKRSLTTNISASNPAAKKAKFEDTRTRRKEDAFGDVLQGRLQPKAGLTNGVKGLGKPRISEGQVQVGAGGDVSMHDASGSDSESATSASESDEGDDEGEDDDDAESELTHGKSVDREPEEMETVPNQEKATTNGIDEPAVPQPTPQATEAEHSPTFGDLLRQNAPSTIDVAASLPESHSQALISRPGERTLTIPTTTSLGTVLTQALRTNDTALLESCLQVGDLNSIRSTIERLNSAHAATLLQTLASRLHKRPGRAGSLLVWVQWTVVAHGGYLAGQREVLKKLRGLERVVKERASGLQPLLALKGKLDMINAQMEIRRRMQRGRAEASEDDDEGVIYVEGRDDEGSSGDEEQSQGVAPDAMNTGVASPRQMGKRGQSQPYRDAEPRPLVLSSDEEEEEEGKAAPNGIGGAPPSDIDEEEADESSDEEEGIFDDEAEETDNDSGDEEISDDDIDLDEVDDEDAEGGESSDEETLAPPGKKRVGGRR